jgi:hypothetical protein
MSEPAPEPPEAPEISGWAWKGRLGFLILALVSAGSLHVEYHDAIRPPDYSYHLLALWLTPIMLCLGIAGVIHPDVPFAAGGQPAVGHYSLGKRVSGCAAGLLGLAFTIYIRILLAKHRP